jgi:anti-sigma factor RsiW
MKDRGCEKVLLARMAEADGERTELSPEEIERHLSTCDNCRVEVAQLENIDGMLKRASRAEQSFDLWPAVSKELTRPAPRSSWAPFVVAAVMLLGYKLVEMLPAKDPGMAIKLVPLIIFAVLVFVLRENPFRINSELVLENNYE